jgi:membrane associated rhomboid family serine protease
MKSLLRDHPVLLALIGFNLLVFLFQVILADGTFTPFFCHPSRIADAWHSLLGGGFEPGAFSAFSGVLTYAFLHADFEHILFNLFYLWVFGYLIGELLGNRWVFLTYLLTAIGGGICYVVFNAGSPVPMLGASGAVSGFEGAYLGLVVRYSLPDPHVWPMSRPVRPVVLAALVLVGVYLDFSGTISPGGSYTAFETHLGGFVTGLFLTSFLTPKPKGV